MTDQIRAGRRPTFTAFFEPERGALSWFVQVPQIYGAATSSSFAEIEAVVRDLVAVTLDVDRDAFDVRLERVASQPFG